MACVEQGTAKANRIRWTCVGLIICAWIFSIVVVAGGKFVIVELESYVEVTYGYSLTYGSGIFSSTMTTYEKVAGAFGVVTVLMVSAAAIILLLLMLFVDTAMKAKLWIDMRILVTIACPFQAGTFAKFGEYVERSKERDTYIEAWWPGPTAVIAAVNIIFLLVLAVLVWLVEAPEKPASQGRLDNTASQETTEKQTTAPPKEAPVATVIGTRDRDTITKTVVESISRDGTRTITTTTVNHDGTKLVEEHRCYEV